MEQLKKEYEEVLSEKEKVLEEMNKLRENELVKRYIDLFFINETLAVKKNNLYRELKLMEYDTCNHIWIISKKEFEVFEGRSFRSYGCVKCGLNQANGFNRLFYNVECDEIMCEYLKKHKGFELLRGIKTEIICDLAIANTIYLKLKEKNPNIDDETFIKILEEELDKIKNDNVSKNGNKKRTKNIK